MHFFERLFHGIEPRRGQGECFMCGAPIDLAKAFYFSPKKRSAPELPVHPHCCRVDPVGIFAMQNEYHRFLTDSIGLSRSFPNPARRLV